jgi:hypothetical protein
MDSGRRAGNLRRTKGRKGEAAMIRVKTFTSRLRIFHAHNELLDLDQAVNDFVASYGIRKVISVSDTVTSGESGEAIGIIRVVAYEDPGEKGREKILGTMEKRLKDWGAEIEKIRGKADKLGSESRAKYQEQVRELRDKQELARQKLHEVKKAGGEAWEDLLAGADSAMNDLKKALEKTVSKWKK